MVSVQENANGAQNDTTTAYNNLASQPCNTNLTGQDLGGKTLTTGVYCFSTSAQLTGALTLDGQGNPNSVFTFQIGSTLTTASASSLLLINGAQSCNVFWQVGSSATLGTRTNFAGSILALTNITLNTGARIFGRALARNGAVTMDTNQVSVSPCSQSPTAAPTSTSTVAPTTATLPPTATATPVPTATATAVPTPTMISIPTAMATSTAPVTTATAEVTPTNTALPSPTTTTTPVATSTATPSATATATAPATSTPVTAATSTPAVGATLTPTPKLGKVPTSTAIASATATRIASRPPSPGPSSVPTVPSTGAGGTTIFQTRGHIGPRGSVPSTGGRSGRSVSGANGEVALPRTGGGAAGGIPASPLVPLGFLGVLAILTGRIVRQWTTR